MTTRHLDIFLDDAEAGMVLASALLDSHGGTLLPKGAELTESVLQSLRRRGVEHLVVVDSGISDEELSKERERAERRLALLFRKSEGRPGNENLRRCILAYRTGGAQ